MAEPSAFPIYSHKRILISSRRVRLAFLLHGMRYALRGTDHFTVTGNFSVRIREICIVGQSVCISISPYR